MNKFEILKSITDVKAFSSLIYDVLKEKDTPEKIECLLEEEISEDELQTLESIAQKGYPLSLERKQ